jgi:DNA polymerase III subunit alpha
VIHLHRHSDDSILDGAGTAFQFAEVAASHGQHALAQTDHGNVNGVLKHIKACEKFGIMPICGVETYWRPNRHVQGQADWRYRRWHLVLLAQNLTGWHNLLRITSEAYASGFYQNPCVDDELLEKHNEGLIATTSCILGPLCFLLENGTDAQADDWLGNMARVFKNRLYVSIMPHDWDRQRSMNLELVSRAARWGLPVIAEGDAHYPYSGWADTQKIVTLISTNTTVAKAAEKNRERLARGDEAYELGHEGLHLMSEQEIHDRFLKYHPDLSSSTIVEAIANTHFVAASIEPFLIDRSLKMPKVANSMEEAEQRIVDWCNEGMQRIRKVAPVEIYEQQLAYELSVLREKKNFDYFLLIGDVVRWAKSIDPLPVTDDDPNPQPKRPMRVGSGRGSAAGSLVSYLCEITAIDPIGHKLKFERFLNPERKGLPDIDIDFPKNRRNEVKEYIARKYGRECVADVMAQQRFQPRAAIKDVARILGSDPLAAKKVTDQIDPVHDTDLEELRKTIPDLDKYANSFPEVWKHAVRLENHGDPLVTRLSKHAGGVIITPGPVTDHMATIRAGEDEVGFRTAWAETPRLSIVDDFGFIKADILSITGMQQQQMILDSIQERTGEIIDLDTLPICQDPRDVEPEVMQAFKDGLTLGVNQFEGENVTTFLRRAQPDDVVDLSAINALYRPGPIGGGGHNRFAKRKTGDSQYIIPQPLEGVLADTYGVLAFQEQIMDLFVVSGYTVAQADGIRKIISKLYREKGDVAEVKLNEHKELFIREVAKLIGQQSAEEVWADIPSFSGYSFNRAHAGGYSVQAYQDMWLKIHYPLDFYAVLLTLEADKIARVMREAQFFDISIFPPDINKSMDGFTIDFEVAAIRFGLIGIKDVGDAASRQVMELRPYSSIEDFTMRNSVKYSKCTKRAREALYEAGALDCFGARNGMTEAEKAKHELMRLGMALRPGAVFGDHEHWISEQIHSESEFEALPDGSKAVIAGMIAEVRKTVVKRGKQAGSEMCFMKVEFGIDSWQCTCFPPAFSANRSLIDSGVPVMVVGRKDDRGAIIVDDMMAVDDYIHEMIEKGDYMPGKLETSPELQPGVIFTIPGTPTQEMVVNGAS